MRYIALTIFSLLLAVALSVAAPSAAQGWPDDFDDPPPLNWDRQGRLTVLLLGIDRRPSDDAPPGMARTDVIIVASLYPAQGTLSLLHVPRDLFMPLNISDPRSDMVRVNALMRHGEQAQPGYGIYWLIDTVADNLQIGIDRYVLVDFEAFITLIDALGGLEITTGYPIYDAEFPDMNYGYDPFVLPAGDHVLSGYDALRFARTRRQDNDYVRGARQMQVIEAIHAQLTRSGALPNLLRATPDLFRSLRDNVQTDIALADIAQIAYTAVLIPPENIITGTLSREYTMSTFTRDGQRVNTPHPNLIPALMSDIFGADYWLSTAQ